MRLFNMLLSSVLLATCAQITTFSYAADDHIESVIRFEGSYQNMDDADSEPKKDVFLNDLLISKIISFTDPLSYLSAGSVCEDWQSICQNNIFMGLYTNRIFEDIKTKINTQNFQNAEKFAQLFVEIEVAKIIEYHRSRFPYANLNQIESSESIRMNSMFNHFPNTLRQPRAQQPRQQVLAFNNPMPLMALAGRNILIQNNQEVQGQVANREAYLLRLENQLKRTLSNLNRGASSLATVRAALALVELNDIEFDNDDDDLENFGGHIINNQFGQDNQERTNDRNLNQAEANFKSLCDRVIPEKMRNLSENYFELLDANRNIHGILFQQLLAEIRDSTEFGAYVDQKVISYRSIYRSIDQDAPRASLGALDSIPLSDEDREDNYLVMLKQLFSKIITGNQAS